MAGSGRELKKWERTGARVPALVDQWGRGPFFVVLAVMVVAAVGMSVVAWPVSVLLGAVALAFGAMGLADISQQSHTILRNFPVLGRLRYFFESVRPELRQYFVESDQEENPYSREKRSIIYQRAKNVLATTPFGTRADVYSTGYTWIAHSMVPKHPEPSAGRILVGEKRCKHPYDASIFNISAMSYGSLSSNAVLALNTGAKLGGFVHNTGEGGVSPYHLQPGGDLVWQVGTGYFGCRGDDGNFSAEKFVETVKHPHIKMIELKLSQGAKPGHGGILPAEKVTLEISQIRGVPMGEDVNSPPAHTAFSTPRGLIAFVTKLRDLSGGKPIGIKLCIGHPSEFLSIVKAMVETGEGPDFIAIDGGEGGTGAAPLEFSNSVGAPLRDGLLFAHDALRGAGIREDIKIFSAGKIATGFH
ncbi:MAG: FMN-binding glutamate synthase family protein, partial [Nannocystaceae bacterium]|nr:FMN-binding glutamate synthase family protein [Nannocystaceae bacterium]